MFFSGRVGGVAPSTWTAVHVMATSGVTVGAVRDELLSAGQACRLHLGGSGHRCGGLGPSLDRLRTKSEPAHHRRVDRSPGGLGSYAIRATEPQCSVPAPWRDHPSALSSCGKPATADLWCVELASY